MPNTPVEYPFWGTDMKRSGLTLETKGRKHKVNPMVQQALQSDCRLPDSWPADILQRNCGDGGAVVALQARCEVEGLPAGSCSAVRGDTRDFVATAYSFFTGSGFGGLTQRIVLAAPVTWILMVASKLRPAEAGARVA